MHQESMAKREETAFKTLPFQPEKLPNVYVGPDGTMYQPISTKLTSMNEIPENL